jgi:PIN domain nuclease of toxin-antitoxin system
MRYLLDTHAIIWLIDESPKMPQGIKDIIINPQNQIFISSVSLWEIAIKLNLGKLDLKMGLNELLSSIRRSEIIVLQIEDAYLQGLSSLPFIHKDPFDRLIITSAITENLTIITTDENIQKYTGSWIW